MPGSLSSLVERLQAEGEKITVSFAALTHEQWNVPVYTEGETWTARALLSHFVAAEREQLKLLADVRDGGGGAAEGFDVDAYNAGQQKKMAQLSPQELLRQFAVVRRETAVLVSGLAVADLEKQGRHPYMGMMSLDEMIKLVYRHNQIHYRDLRRALSDWLA